MKMNRLRYNIFIALLFFIILSTVSVVVIAAGGGGDGTLGCNEDIYECTDWGECTPEGVKFRTCELVTLCPDADNEAPYEDEPCEYIEPAGSLGTGNSGSGSSGSPTKYQSKVKCGTEPTSKERMKCRFRLTANDIPDGINIAFMPEECRTASDSESKELCIGRYSGIQPCLKGKRAGIDQCIKTSLGIGDIQERMTACKSSAACAAGVKEDVYSLIKSRIYALEYRAETMLAKGLITENQASEIVFQLEQQLLGFNNAPDKTSRIRALENVKNKWAGFIDGLKIAGAQK